MKPRVVATDLDGTIVRGMAHSVPLRVATGRVPCGNLPRMSSRRAWKSVQFDAEVSSR